MRPPLQSERRYGVEIEFYGDDDALEVALASRGITVENEGRYTHDVTSGRTWKIVTDGSLSDNGWELVSPPLRGARGAEQIRLVCEALRETGCMTSASCGLHVHQEVRDLNAKQFARVLRFYYEAQPAIRTILPRSRHENGYATELHPRTVETAEGMHSLEWRSDSHAQALMESNRYLTVNPTAFPKYGTIEFRQHQGTLSAEKILAWVDFTRSIIAWAIGDHSLPVPTIRDIISMLAEHCALPEASRDHLLARAAPVDPPALPAELVEAIEAVETVRAGSVRFGYLYPRTFRDAMRIAGGESIFEAIPAPVWTSWTSWARNDEGVPF